MEINMYILMIIICSAIVTFIPRVLPLLVLSRINLPEWGERWLTYVPIAVMAALISQEILFVDEKISIKGNIELFAALPTFLVAIFSRSLLATVVTGIVTMMIFRFLFI